jgi:hypothetical protein
VATDILDDETINADARSCRAAEPASQTVPFVLWPGLIVEGGKGLVQLYPIPHHAAIDAFWTHIARASPQCVLLRRFLRQLCIASTTENSR